MKVMLEELMVVEVVGDSVVMTYLFLIAVAVAMGMAMVAGLGWWWWRLTS